MILALFTVISEWVLWVSVTMDNRAQGNWIGNAHLRDECRFRVKYAATSRYSGLSGVKVASLGIH